MAPMGAIGSTYNLPECVFKEHSVPYISSQEKASKQITIFSIFNHER